jgi:bifunctional oligoribonuclease and PAP phosphatase NrnA
VVTPVLRRKFAQLLKSEKRFVVAGHHGPDGDVIGSTLAMALGLKQLGKNVLAYNEDGCPESLRFLPKTKMIKNAIPRGFQTAVLITVDSGDLKRLGEGIVSVPFSAVWNVDHHHSNTQFGTYNFLDVKAGSTGQVVLNLLEACRGFKLTKDIATCAFCTLSTDTGSFRYSNSTEQVFADAAKWVKAGARPDVISEALYESYPQRRLKLLTRVLSSLEFDFSGQFAKLFLSLEDLEKTGALGEDSEDFVNLPRGVVGVKIVCFFKQKDVDTWKLSFRSRDRVNVLKVAQAFGGGGHKVAAGCTVRGDRASVERQVSDQLVALGYF